MTGDPKIVPPRGGSGTAHADQQARRRELARDILLTLLARDDVRMTEVTHYPETFIKLSVKLADEFLARVQS